MTSEINTVRITQEMRDLVNSKLDDQEINQQLREKHGLKSRDIDNVKEYIKNSNNK